MYGIGWANRYRIPLIVAAAIPVVLGVAAVMLLARPDSGSSQAIESPPVQTSKPISTAFAVASPETPKGAATEPIVAPASECDSVAIAQTSTESDESGLIVLDGYVFAGELLSVPIVLSQAPAGLAGYDVRLDVDDPSIARLARIDFPDFGLVREIEASEQGVRIAAVDLFGIVEVGDADSTLATVTIEGAGKGATLIQLSIIRMDDDSGDPMTPQVYAGTVTVC